MPPDTEIIKYTSSIVGPKIPGTTNRGRKKTISLDSPNVSVHAPPIQTMSAHQTNTTTTSMMLEPRKYNRTSGLQNEANDYRESIDRVEVIKLPAHSTNGSVLSAPPIYTTCNTTNANLNANDSDAPLNLSLKPASTSSNSPIPGSQPLSQLSNLSHSLLTSDRTCESHTFFLNFFHFFFFFAKCSFDTIFFFFGSSKKTWTETEKSSPKFRLGAGFAESVARATFRSGRLAAEAEQRKRREREHDDPSQGRQTEKSWSRSLETEEKYGRFAPRTEQGARYKTNAYPRSQRTLVASSLFAQIQHSRCPTARIGHRPNRRQKSGNEKLFEWKIILFKFQADFQIFFTTKKIHFSHSGGIFFFFQKLKLTFFFFLFEVQARGACVLIDFFGCSTASRRLLFLSIVFSPLELFFLALSLVEIFPSRCNSSWYVRVSVNSLARMLASLGSRKNGARAANSLVVRFIPFFFVLPSFSYIFVRRLLLSVTMQQNVHK